mmetsp:Transcript_3120/g.7582  ORF Transcript_3120/g.7582 Transcript_3120/m.7582 type:complete len:284 (+) Transcript_3120:194-1045(+)
MAAAAQKPRTCRDAAADGHRPLAARAESKTTTRRHAGLGHDQDGQAHLFTHFHHQRRSLRRLRAASAAHAQFTGEENGAVNWELGSSENSTRSARAALLRGRLEHLHGAVRAAGGGSFSRLCGGVLRALFAGAARFGVGRAGRASMQVRSESLSALRRRPRAGRRRPAARAGEAAHDRRSCQHDPNRLPRPPRGAALRVVRRPAVDARLRKRQGRARGASATARCPAAEASRRPVCPFIHVGRRDPRLIRLGGGGLRAGRVRRLRGARVRGADLRARGVLAGP